MHKLKAILILSFCFATNLWAQRTEILQPHIETVQLIVNDDYRLPPILNLGSDDYIDISFDQLSHDYRRYQYIISHCNTDWKRSDISDFDFLDGFNNNYIENVETSMNTMVPYTHYRFSLPNDDVRLTASGNYMVEIFDEDNKDKPVLRTFFRVAESQVSISATVSSDTDIDRNKAHQQVSFDINYKGYTIRNPQQEIKIHVLQNERIDNMVTNALPSYVSPTELRYTNNRSLIFPAGNEYRRFEIVSTKYAGMGVESLGYYAPYYHATLYADHLRTLNYIYDADQNGKYLVRYNDAVDSNTEADYFFVHFALDSEHSLSGGKVYLQGEFTYDLFNEQTQMKYNSESYMYESVQLLKQGSYNYQYLYVPQGSTKGETGPTEGNFYQTENDYLILVYHKPFGERYDRLIGVKQITFTP